LARLEVVSTAVGPGVVPSAPAVLETIASMLAADVRAPALVLSLADEDGDELALVAVLALVPSLVPVRALLAGLVLMAAPRAGVVPAAAAPAVSLAPVLATTLVALPPAALVLCALVSTTPSRAVASARVLSLPELAPALELAATSTAAVVGAGCSTPLVDPAAPVEDAADVPMDVGCITLGALVGSRARAVLVVGSGAAAAVVAAAKEVSDANVVSTVSILVLFAIASASLVMLGMLVAASAAARSDVDTAADLSAGVVACGTVVVVAPRRSGLVSNTSSLADDALVVAGSAELDDVAGSRPDVELESCADVSPGVGSVVSGAAVSCPDVDTPSSAVEELGAGVVVVAFVVVVVVVGADVVASPRLAASEVRSSSIGVVDDVTTCSSARVVENMLPLD